MTLLTRKKRAGAAFMLLVIVLAGVTLVMAAMTWQTMAQLKLQREREHQLQAYWLAEAGIELAAAQLLVGDQKPPSGKDLFPGAEVQIKIEPVKDQERTYRVTSEARYPLGDPIVIDREVTRVFRVVGEGNKVRLEVP